MFSPYFAIIKSHQSQELCVPPSVTVVTVTEVAVVVMDVKTDKAAVSDTNVTIHSTALLSHVAPSSGSSAVHKY